MSEELGLDDVSQRGDGSGCVSFWAGLGWPALESCKCGGLWRIRVLTVAKANGKKDEKAAHRHDNEHGG